MCYYLNIQFQGEGVNYPARKSHVLRAVMLPVACLPVCLCHIFPHYVLKGTIFGGKKFEHKICVLIFSSTFV